MNVRTKPGRTTYVWKLSWKLRVKVIVCVLFGWEFCLDNMVTVINEEDLERAA